MGRAGFEGIVRNWILDMLSLRYLLDTQEEMSG